MTRVFLTGSTGALGRSVANRLSADPANYSVYAPGRDLTHGMFDLRNPDQTAQAIVRFQPNYLIHLAATFSDNFDEAFAVNVAATRYMLEAVMTSGLPVRVVLVGSAAEYGAVTADENPINEDHVLRPLSVYGISKAWQTELAYLYASRGVNVVVARIFNLYGPHLSERLFIGRLHKQISELRRGERSRIEIGPLSAVRDYVSINEATSQLLSVSKLGEKGKVYHIASGTPITMRELLIRELTTYGLDMKAVVEGATFSNRLGYDIPVIYADVCRTAALMQLEGSNVEH